MNYRLVVLGIFIIVSLINSYLDFRTLHISIILNYAGVICSLVIILFCARHEMVNKIQGGFFLFLIFILVRQIAHKGLGWGDIHYSLFCGFISGIPGFIFSALCSSFCGILFFFVLRFIFKNKNALKLRIPFIPMMFLGTIIGIPISNYVMKFL